MHIKQQDLKIIADALEDTHFSPRTMRIANWALCVLTVALVAFVYISLYC